MKHRAWMVAVAGVALASCNGEGAQTEGGPEATDTAPQAQTEEIAVGVGTAAEARTVLLGAQGDTVGTATLREGPDGVRISVEVTGLQPGAHGFHVHQVGRCDPPGFTSAGGHFAPAGRQHGLENPQGPHAGDLQNLEVGQDGTARQEITTDRITLGEGANSVFDADGAALVVHAGPDDHRTDPSGNSGDRVACGAITRGE